MRARGLLAEPGPKWRVPDRKGALKAYAEQVRKNGEQDHEGHDEVNDLRYGGRPSLVGAEHAPGDDGDRRAQDHGQSKDHQFAAGARFDVGQVVGGVRFDLRFHAEEGRAGGGLSSGREGRAASVSGAGPGEPGAGTGGLGAGLGGRAAFRADGRDILSARKVARGGRLSQLARPGTDKSSVRTYYDTSGRGNLFGPETRHVAPAYVRTRGVVSGLRPGTTTRNLTGGAVFRAKQRAVAHLRRTTSGGRIPERQIMDFQWAGPVSPWDVAHAAVKASNWYPEDATHFRNMVRDVANAIL